MARGKREKGEFEHIGAILQGVMRGMQNGLHADLMLISKIWPTVVDAATAQNAQPAAIKQKTLTVHVTSPAWIQHLRFHQNDMIRQINQAAGRDLITDMRFKIGGLHS